MKVVVNIKLLEQQFLKPANKKVIERACTPVISDRVSEYQRELIEEFESHPVTVEIDNGPTASNTSNTLNGYGNLYSFIGFEEPPLKNIRDILYKDIKISVKYTNPLYENLRITLQNAPDIEKIFRATPLPWATDSWARRIELGLSGFGNYLNKRESSPSSRSGFGFQVEDKMRGGKFRNTSYISKMLKNFNRKLSKRLL